MNLMGERNRRGNLNNTKCILSWNVTKSSTDYKEFNSEAQKMWDLLLFSS